MPTRERRASRIEAKWLLLRHLAALRRQPYAQLAERIDDADHIQVTGRSGRTHQIEMLYFWDAKPGGSIRLIGSIDNGVPLRSSVYPMRADALVHPPPPDYDETWVERDVPGFRAAPRVRRAITLLFAMPLFVFLLWRIVNLTWDA